MFTILVLLAMTAWLLLLVAPTRSWLNGEVLDAVASRAQMALPLTVLIPARNESAFIAETIEAVEAQAPDAAIIVVDDDSSDGTGEIAAATGSTVEVIRPGPRPEGWSGKLWALEAGLASVATPRVLLLDADITVHTGMLAAMLDAMDDKGVRMLSIMARLRTESIWEKLLIPSFVFFFKQIYPFRLSNGGFRHVAAAAGGCILVDTAVLKEIGGFAAIRHNIIDDCALARKIKDRGHRIWIGLSHQVTSRRRYDTLGSIWIMVDRTAWSQLGFSVLMLLICTLAMMLCFWVPVAGLFHPGSWPYAGLALAAMFTSYMPTLWFYRRSPLWALCLPLIGTLYLMMTWSSALKHLLGRGIEWKGRRYAG